MRKPKSIQVKRDADNLINIGDDFSGGRTTAALVPVSSNTDLESFGLSTNPEFIQMLEESRRQLKEKRGASLADVKKEFGLK